MILRLQKKTLAVKDSHSALQQTQSPNKKFKVLGRQPVVPIIVTMAAEPITAEPVVEVPAKDETYPLLERSMSHEGTYNNT